MKHLSSSTFLGPWVRLEGIATSQLPPGAKGNEPSNQTSASPEFFHDPGSAPAPDIKSFITSVLSESIPFIDGVAPKSGGPTTWKVNGSPKKYSSSTAPVHLYECTVLGKELDKLEGMSQYSADRKDETWFCRRSVHKDAAEEGTANFDEFKHNFKEHHAESEVAFTPTVIDRRDAMRWDTSGIEVEVRGGLWNNITVVVEEMKHKIDPKPLKNRTFPVIQIAAALEGTREFIFVSIPVHNFDKSPYAEFALDKALVVAAYVSIERIRVLPTNGDIEWVMATAANAKGVLPQWMQNLAVPGAIGKDVELFMSWIPSQRHTNPVPAPISKSGPQKTLPRAPASSNDNNDTNTTHPPISKAGTKPSAMGIDSSNKELPAAPAQ
ncbi:Uncharacterized protein BP5553_07730 [Venustampulla echinocandica]|uniref:DUF3074 domain-containing protein n=1 Tax=Venustampulla echinocandica TaxID=2656787 RepID=A0A370THC9_9HELO|nr:Uncharacterized protein BP5553_07730 [Venustampulla echinocandica]RDL34602.1 Uncharacterized protein BP5553_07730 [Venustampulla echinocandica]